MHDRRIGARFGAILAAGALALAVAAPVAAQAEITSIGYASPEEARDLGWNELGLIAAQEAADGIGATLLKADGAGWGDVVPTLDNLKADGAELIIAQASAFGASAVQWAKDNDVPVLVWEQDKQVTPGLIGDIETSNQEGGYLAGVLAANTTQTGTVGVVLSATGDPNWQKGAGGFLAGVKSVDPSINVVRAAISVDGYGEQAGGRQVTEQVIAAGADVILGFGDGSAWGMLGAIESNTPPGAEKAWFIDVIGDKSDPVSDRNGVVLSSILWDFSVAYDQALADLAAGTYGEAPYVLTAENGGMRMLETAHIDAEVLTALADARAGIIDGSITIPETPSEELVDELETSLAGS